MKKLMIAILMFSSSAFAQLSAEGKSTVYPMSAQPQTLVISITGKAAGALYDSLSAVPVNLANEMGLRSDQKVSSNISCIKTQNMKTYKMTYQCELTVTDGVVGAGAAG